MTGDGYAAGYDAGYDVDDSRAGGYFAAAYASRMDASGDVNMLLEQSIEIDPEAGTIDDAVPVSAPVAASVAIDRSTGIGVDADSGVASGNHRCDAQDMMDEEQTMGDRYGVIQAESMVHQATSSPPTELN